ncbi:FAD-linked sulfhydryl oxidase ALR [Lepeophtheirus salmonis]|uniref:FAD-linked sulfhydryl oxidase ALR n=1 Tax=Lepeophtheirus salmonis TaxID=72036 RepID=UPI001AE4CBA0|nr:FAD-linked sulfhydryl oxidase ALR-like [Lepeophtheirus salmonis]
MVRRRSHYNDDEEESASHTFNVSGTNKKPCRTCTDFKSHMRENFKEDKKKECPPDKTELGRSTWTLLHTTSVNLPEKSPLDNDTKSHLGHLLTSLSNLYPCEYCAQDFRLDLKQNPPKFNTGRDFAQWLCEAHNRVNLKLDKPLFDCSRVYYRWRDAECD